MSLKKYKLGDIATIEISGVDKKVKDGEIPVKLCNFVDVYYNWAVTAPMLPQFMEATARQSEIDRFTLHKGQVALTKDSETRFDIGISTYIADDFDNVILGYHNALITPNPDFLNGKYLNALLHTEYARTYFANNASGSGQRYALSVDALNSLPVYLPSIEEQERIGNIFSSIDRKIELNREINRNLEAQAKQLYDYWFVQFDFSDENGKPFKSSGGEMVWNDKLKRKIPKGWSVNNIFDELSVQYGFPFSTEKFTDESTSVPVVRIRDIIDNTISTYSQEDTDEKYKLNEADLLIGMDGNFHMNFWIDNFAYLNQRCVRLRAKHSSSVSIVQARFDIAPYIKAKELRAKGSTVGHLSDKDLKELNVLVCHDNRLRYILDSLLEKIIVNRKEIIYLTRQRDELLPLLMNGQVSVKPTEVNCDLSHD
ncbi:MAG: restriction endonuclease subunit S [Muribaculaceae bacterium]|nr:restriction endonuclease subunit S [Muribaculaceae bacterium]